MDNMRLKWKELIYRFEEKAYFHFALIQGCEFNQKYEEAFYHLEQGNKIKNSQSKYSVRRMSDELQAQINVCDESFFEQLGEGIWCVGPNIYSRSATAGSTLIEQILASPP